MESVVIPQDTSAYLPATLENGDSQASTDLAEQAKAEGEEEEKAEVTPAKPQPRVKSKRLHGPNQARHFFNSPRRSVRGRTAKEATLTWTQHLLLPPLRRSQE